MKRLKSHWADIRYLTLFPRRYKPPKGLSMDCWDAVLRRYCNMEKTISSSSLRWRVIHYDDGRKELAYLRVLQGGLFSGFAPAIYRGVIIPRMVDYGTFAHIRTIELAF